MFLITHNFILHKKQKNLISFTAKFGCVGVSSATSSTSSKWLLSPTLEVSSEEKTSLINNLKTDSEGVTDLMVATATAVGGTGGNKYEKLRSNDQQTSDDSDSEYFQEDHAATGSIKKAIFKQIVSNNIPDTIHKIQQAAYHKVDKTQIKVPIVKKLHRHATKKPTTAALDTAQQVNVVLEKHEQQQQQAAAIAAAVVAASADAAAKKNQNNSDADSIGSASDLRAEDDDFFDEHGLKNNSKFRRAVPDMDGISESVKTCSSSAYHAECESVTTHEDDVSRVVVKVRMRKKDRIAAAVAALATVDSVGANNVHADDNELSPNSHDDFLHKFGDKPLLLDDELDYNSSDTDSQAKQHSSKSNSSDSSNETTGHETPMMNEREELDVFAMAPFKVPIGFPVKKRTTRAAVTKSMTTVVVPPKKQLEMWTSTPNKKSEELENFANFIPQTMPSPQLDEFQEPIFNPFIKTATAGVQQQQQQQHVQSCSNFGTVTVISTSDSIKQQIPPTIKFEVDFEKNREELDGIKELPKHDLFGSEPFPQVILKGVSTVGTTTTATTTTNNIVQFKTSPLNVTNTTTHSNNNLNSQIITVNHSIIINKTPEPRATSRIINVQPIVNAPRHSTVLSISNQSTNNTIQTNAVPTYLQKPQHAQQTLFPIADNGFVQISQDQCSDFTPDDEEEPVVIINNSDREHNLKTSDNNIVSSIKSKKEKSHIGVRTLPAKITQKVKAKVTAGNLGSTSSLSSSSKHKHQRLNYKSQEDDDEDYENVNEVVATAAAATTVVAGSKSKSSKYFQSNTIQNSAKTGFSNMSFEDFPSDQEIDRLSKTLPFEVVRNEKMLLEAEKKFGSLKRRNNLFS